MFQLERFRKEMSPTNLIEILTFLLPSSLCLYPAPSYPCESKGLNNDSLLLWWSSSVVAHFSSNCCGIVQSVWQKFSGESAVASVLLLSCVGRNFFACTIYFISHKLCLDILSSDGLTTNWCLLRISDLCNYEVRSKFYSGSPSCWRSDMGACLLF